MKKMLHCIALLFATAVAQAADVASVKCDVSRGLETMQLSFLVDANTGKSYVIGNAGQAEVTFIRNKGGGLTFIEVTPTGNVATTTLDDSGRAVHSRNMIIAGELTPSQYLGRCR